VSSERPGFRTFLLAQSALKNRVWDYLAEVLAMHCLERVPDARVCPKQNPPPKRKHYPDSPCWDPEHANAQWIPLGVKVYILDVGSLLLESGLECVPQSESSERTGKQMQTYNKNPEAVSRLSPEQYRITQTDGTERPFDNARLSRTFPRRHL
jgi:hypothetical protein